MNTVGATEYVPLFQLDCVSLQITIGCLQLDFLLLLVFLVERNREALPRSGRNTLLFPSISHISLLPAGTIEMESASKEQPACSNSLVSTETRLLPFCLTQWQPSLSIGMKAVSPMMMPSLASAMA